MPQTLSCDLLLYADDSCLVYQHKDIDEIAIVLNKKFSDLCDWFLDNKLSIHFGDDKTKCILFASKNKVNKSLYQTNYHERLNSNKTYDGRCKKENKNKQTNKHKQILVTTYNY